MSKSRPARSNRITPAEAARRAIGYAQSLIAGLQDPLVEETELSEDEKFWFITISFVTLPGFGPKEYKVLKVDSTTGAVLSMKIRKG